MVEGKKLDRILTIFEQVARTEILQDFRMDSCIGSTKVAVRVFDYFGFHAIPFPTFCTVYNKNMVDAVLNGEFPTDGKPTQQWFDERGAWSVGLGIAKDGNLDPVGHLICVLPEERVLVDASLDQASRPQHNMNLPGVLVGKCSKRFIECAKTQEYISDPNQGSIIYHPKPDLRKYLESDNWNIEAQTDRAVQAIVNKISRSL